MTKESPFLETPRLILRPWVAKDHALFVSLCQAEGLADFSSGRFEAMTEKKAEEFLAREIEAFKRQGFCRFAVLSKSSGALIGVAGLFEMSDVNFNGAIGLGYRFPREHWGQGYATEACRELIRAAFGTLGLSEVLAIIDPDNDRSKHVAKKLGFKPVGKTVYKTRVKELWSLRKI